MPNNTSKKSQSALQENKETVGAEKSKATTPAEQRQAKKQTKESGKTTAAPKAPKVPEAPKVPDAPKVSKEPEAPEAPEGSGKKPGKTSKSGKPRKQHKRKGAANDAPPSSIGMTQVAYAALLVAEAAEPDATRKQVIENALVNQAKEIAYRPPIQLARLNSDTLITLAGVAATWEKKCKVIFHKIILAELDDEEKAKLVGELEIEIQNLRDERLTLCRMAGIPICHDITTDMNIAIGGLMELKKEIALKQVQNSYDNAIQILMAYKPCEPGNTPKPGETLPPVDQENPEKPNA